MIFISEKNDDLLYKHEFYDVHRRERPREIDKKDGGGDVLVYVKKNLNSYNVVNVEV